MTIGKSRIKINYKEEALVKMKPKFSKEILISKNFLAGIIGCIFSILAMLFNKEPSSPYPAIVFSLMLLMSVLVLIGSFMSSNSDRCKGFSWKELLLMAILFINPLLAKYFGFYVTVFIEILAITILINKDRSKKGIMISVIFSAVLVAVSYLAFTYGLRIRCPKGKIISLF